MANVVVGEVVEIGPAGSLVTDIAESKVADAPRDENVKIKFGGHETVGLYPEIHEQPDATMVASLGSSGYVEIEIVGMSLAEMLGIGKGTQVEVEW